MFKAKLECARIGSVLEKNDKAKLGCAWIRSISEKNGKRALKRDALCSRQSLGVLE